MSDLGQLALLAQIIGSVAVVASLIFVGLQLRQASAAIRASSSQAHSALYISLVQSIIDNGDFAGIWVRGIDRPSDLNEEEWARFVGYSSALFRLYETSRVQWLNGRLDQDHWHTIEGQAMGMRHLPGLEEAWRARRAQYTAAFQHWFDNLPERDMPHLYERRESTDE